MAKRRKSRKLGGLAGSPAQHAQRAKKAGKVAAHEAGVTMRLVEKGDCYAAILAYGGAREALGEARAHVNEASGLRPIDVINFDADRAASDALLKVCSVSPQRYKSLAKKSTYARLFRWGKPRAGLRRRHGRR